MAVNHRHFLSSVYKPDSHSDFVFDASTLLTDELFISEMMGSLDESNNKYIDNTAFSNGISDFSGLKLPNDRLRVLEAIDYIRDITELDELDKNLEISIDPSKIEEVKRRRVCDDSWTQRISPLITNFNNYNGIIPETKNKLIKRFGDNEFKNIEVLTGGISELQLKDDSQILRKHILISKKIIEYVHRTIPFSENYLLRSRIFRLCNQDDPILPKVKNIIDFVADVSFTECKESEINVANVSFVTQKHRVSTCFGMSVVGFSFAVDFLKSSSEYLKLEKLPSIELYKIRNGDHSFMVIGRDQNSAPNDYLKWGSDAVICDVWTGACYPANEVENYLYSYDASTSFEIQNEYATVVERFQPKLHSLELEDFLL